MIHRHSLILKLWAGVLSYFFAAGMAFAEVPVIDATSMLNGEAEEVAKPAVEAKELSEESIKATRHAADSSGESDAVILNRIARLENQLASHNSQDAVSQMEALRRENVELRNQVEMNAHQVDQLSKKLVVLNTQTHATPTTAKEVSSSETTPKEDPKEIEAYRKGYEAIKARDFEKAKVAFQDYARQYSNGNYSANAHFWLGEIYYHQKSLTKASNEFKQVLINPKNAKYPDALLKMGFIYSRQGAWGDARKNLDLVKQQYPGTTVANLADAKLQELTEQGH